MPPAFAARLCWRVHHIARAMCPEEEKRALARAVFAYRRLMMAEIH